MRQFRYLLLDTNVLILFIVGSTDPALIGGHRRLSSFTREDFVLLAAIISRAEQLVFLPNIATEASNLLGQPEGRDGRRILQTFRTFLEKAREVYIETPAAAARPEFWYLDLTDCALLSNDAEDTVIVSTDAKFCYNAQLSGLNVLNFNHVRDASW